MNKCVAESIGTFWLVLGGCGSAVLAAAFQPVATLGALKRALSGALAGALACLLLPGVSHAQDGDLSLQGLGAAIVQTTGPTVYVAREFVTMDPKRPRAQAVCVQDGKFVAIGTRAEVEASACRNAKLDSTFADKVVMPGFIEQHVHPVLAALTMSTTVISIEDWDAIDGFSPVVRDAQGYQARLKAALAAQADKSQPFVTWGYHHYFHGPLSRETLDNLAPTTPVIVWHRSAHEFYLNSAALKLTGIDAAFMAGRSKSAQEQTSLERGQFFEQGAVAILGKLAPIIATPARFKRGLEYTSQYYHRAGITLACEPGSVPTKPIQDAINAVFSGPATPFNHCFIASGQTLAAQHRPDAAALLKGTEAMLDWGQGRTAYLPRQVKLLTDGAIFSQLMMMTDGYTDGHHGAWLMDPPVFGFAFQSYWDAGYQIHVHNNGDGGLDVLLGEVEKAMARNPRKDHRTVLVHFGFARPEQVEKWIKLGGIVSSNPYYVTALAGLYGKQGMTPYWAENMVPHGEVLKHGGSLSFHSDMPMAPAKPLQLVWAAVNRTTYEGEVAGERHKVPLDAALKAVTIDAAYSIQQEQRVGSIELGKDANLVILDQSPYEVQLEKLKDIGVWGTMLEGRVQPAPRPQQAALAAAGEAVTASDAVADGALTGMLAARLVTLLRHSHGIELRFR